MERNDHMTGIRQHEPRSNPNTADFDLRHTILHDWISTNEAELLLGLRPLARTVCDLRGQDLDETRRELLVEMTSVAITNADDYDSGRDPHLWLLGIARNIVKQWRDRAIKQNQRITVVWSSPGNSEDAAIDMFDRLHTAAHAPGIEEVVTGNAWVKHLLSNLKTEEAQLVRLMAIDGYSAEEAGVVLHLGSGNVRVKLHRILKKLRIIEANETMADERSVGPVPTAIQGSRVAVQHMGKEAQTGGTTP